MIEEELLKIHETIPNVDKSDKIIKKIFYSTKTEKSWIPFSFVKMLISLSCLVILPIMVLVMSKMRSTEGITLPRIDNVTLEASNDKMFYAEKFNSVLETDGGGSELINAPIFSFLNYEGSWNKMTVNSVSEYVVIYLENDIYNLCNEYFYNKILPNETKIIDGKTYWHAGGDSYVPIDIESVNGIIFSFYYVYTWYSSYYIKNENGAEIIRLAKTFNVNGIAYDFEEYAALKGKNIKVCTDNFIIKKANNIVDLKIEIDGYHASAYYFCQQFNYHYNYQNNNTIDDCKLYYGSMVAYEDSNKNIYYNKLDIHKEYVIMDNVSLYAYYDHMDWSDLNYNIFGKKQYIAFEIFKKDQNEYICLEDNADIETIELLSNGENYDIILTDKFLEDKCYYGIKDLIKANRRIVLESSLISKYNSERSREANNIMQNIVSNYQKTAFKIDYENSEQIPVVTSGMVIYETPKEVGNIQVSEFVENNIGYTNVKIDQFNVRLNFSISDKNISLVDKIKIEWIIEDNINKLVLIYSEEVKGATIRVVFGYDTKKYTYSYISYFGAKIERMVGSGCREYFDIELN